MKEILTIKDLSYKSILKDLNFNIKENTFNLITGSNKCGKTTLIKILSGIIETNSVYLYKQKEINQLKSYEFSTIFSHVIFTGNFNFKFSTLNQEILYKLDQLNLTTSQKKMKYKHLLKIFNLDKVVTNNINELTTFQKLKILILLRLLSNPKILLLDNILDDLAFEEVKEIIKILRQIGGITVIISSNSLLHATLFDYIYVLDKSKIILWGETLTVLKEDSTLNKIGLFLPFIVDLSLKLKYYDLVDDIILDENRMVDELWK